MSTDLSSSLATQSEVFVPPVVEGLASDITRAPFYFVSQGEPVFAWLHTKTQGAMLDHAVILCAPHGFEQLHAHCGLRHLAESLARECLPVIRFDWAGTADSSGDEDDHVRSAAWIANVRDAARLAKTKLGVRHVSIVGLRAGALLAAEAMQDAEFENTAFENLVLWSPVVSGRAYVRELKVIDRSSALPTLGAAAGGSIIEAGGFAIAERTAAELATLDLLKSRPKCRQALIVARDDQPLDNKLAAHLTSLGIGVDERQLPGTKQMLTYPHESEVPTPAIAEISSWLRARASAAQPGMIEIESTTLGEPETLLTHHERRESTTSAHTLREFAWQSPGPRLLLGIVTEPEHTRPETPLVVLLNTGAAARWGVGRLNVLLARNFATRGIRSVRLDLSGLGDSPVQPSARESDPYSGTAFVDVATALVELRQRFDFDRSVLIGLCSGAYAAFQAAVQLDDPTLVESVLINPLAFYWKDEMDQNDPAVREQLEEYWRLARGFDAQRVWRFVSGRGDLSYLGALRQVGRAISRRVCRKLQPRQPEVAIVRTAGHLGHPETEDLASDLRQVVQKHRRLSMFLSLGDPGLAMMKAHARREVKRLLKSGTLTVQRIPKSDHSFTRRSPRNELIDRLGEHLAQAYCSP
jgi:pimeloyl-ACP methyl ester carboxylesterase